MNLIQSIHQSTGRPSRAMFCITLVSAMLCLLLLSGVAAADPYPKPSIYPVSWQLDFTHGAPRRIVVDVPGKGSHPYYYLTYTVTNKTDQDRTFFPGFVMVTRQGKAIQSDNGIPVAVLETIRRIEKNPALESNAQIAGKLRQGDDQAKQGVAIWPEPEARMGTFSIYVGGLSGEFVILKDDKGNEVKDEKGNPIILRKTLQLNYQIEGDEVYPGEDHIHQLPEKWVMR